jgi:methylation protein EvaC
MSFGSMPRASGFLDQTQFDSENFFELKPALCCECKLFQIIDVPQASTIFHDSYPHLTSSSKVVVQHFRKLSQLVAEQYLRNSSAFLVEIGSNDGSLLEPILELGIRHLGVEPATDIANIAVEKGINTLVKFFGTDTALEIRKAYGPADVIIGANVIAHIPDINGLVNGVRTLLKEDGVFIFEAVYLGDLVRNTSYSQIYDEHVFNFSIESVQNIFRRHDLELFDAEKIDLQGGSMRYFLTPIGSKIISSRVTELLEEELKTGLNEVQTMDQFRKRCETSRENIINLVESIRGSGNRIAGYGAATKSTIILNYTGLDTDSLDFIVDSTSAKQGKYSPGMHIPIKSPEYFRNHYPDYTIIFPWNHFDEITRKEREYRNCGGQWILPLLSPEVRH